MTDPDLVTRLKQGSTVWNTWRKRHPVDQQFDLRDAILVSANLRGANLHNATLSNANLSGANLRDATLFGANLDGADLHIETALELLLL